MYLYDTMKGAIAVSFCEGYLKMDAADWDLDAVNRVEVFVTGLNLGSNSNPDPDYCEYRVYDCHDKLMAVKREFGY